MSADAALTAEGDFMPSTDINLPDLVHDSRLETVFLDDGAERHTFIVPDPQSRRRRVVVQEEWRRVGMIGQGGFGTVWKEKCVSDGSFRTVRAVKQISKGRSPREYQMVLREMEAVTKFSHDRYSHCFVKSFGWFEDATSIYIAMEYLDYGDLQKYMEKPIPERDAQIITSQVLEGLDFMHQNAFAHRDLRPSNILIADPGTNWWVKISDFGISKRNSDLFENTLLMGTLSYMAPETLGFNKYVNDQSGEVPKPTASDIWALGAITYHMVTSALPFERMNDILTYTLDYDIFPRGPLDAVGATEECIAFCQALLAPKILERPTADVAMVSPWCTSSRLEEEALEQPATELFAPISQKSKKKKKKIKNLALTPGRVVDLPQSAGAPTPDTVSPQSNDQATASNTEKLDKAAVKEVLLEESCDLQDEQSPDNSKSHAATLRTMRDVELNADYPVEEPKRQPIAPEVETFQTLKLPAVSQMRIFSIRKTVHVATYGGEVLGGTESPSPAFAVNPMPTVPVPLPLKFETTSGSATTVKIRRAQRMARSSNSAQNGAPPKNTYTYIPIGCDHVRLLLLEKGEPEDNIHCSLKTISMTSSHEANSEELPHYQALSYVWGPGNVSLEPIYLRDTDLMPEGRSMEEFYRLVRSQGLPRLFHVRPNLFAALKRLRAKDVDLWFWVDAICINQTDQVEKSHQLPKMLDIYRNALNVSIWLGENDDPSPSTNDMHPLEFIEDITNLGVLDSMVSEEGLDDDTAQLWVDFANLLKNDWFRRRWIIQEVAASSHASVTCGSRSINWIDFADATELFMMKLEQIRALFEKMNRPQELAPCAMWSC